MLVLAVLMRTDSCVRVELRRLRIHWDMLKKIVRVGIPAALQMAVTAFSNVFVQSYINHFGADCMSGWTAYTKIDQLMFLPMQSLPVRHHLCGAEPGRRRHPRPAGRPPGAGDLPGGDGGADDPGAGVRSPADGLLQPQGRGGGLRHPAAAVYLPFYLLCCINQIYSGALRGAGNSQVPMVIMLGSFVVFRQIYLYIVSHFITNTLLPLAMGYPAGWLVCSAATLLYYRRPPWAGSAWWRITKAGGSPSMRQINVSLGQRSYPILIYPGLLGRADERLSALPVKRWPWWPTRLRRPFMPGA